jgi:hypothetical protein
MIRPMNELQERLVVLMILSEEQRRLMMQLAEAFDALSDQWTDELGEVLNAAWLLPKRCIVETAAEYRHAAEVGEIISFIEGSAQ